MTTNLSGSDGRIKRDGAFRGKLALFKGRDQGDQHREKKYFTNIFLNSSLFSTSISARLPTFKISNEEDNESQRGNRSLCGADSFLLRLH